MYFDDSERKEADILHVNRYQVQENAVFLDYNPEVLTKDIDQYEDIKFHLRLSLSKNLLAVEQSLKSQENKPKFYKLLEFQSQDHEDIQKELIEYLIIKIDEPLIPSDFKQLLIVPLTNLVKGSYLEIKEQSCELITKLAHRLDIEEKSEIIKLAVELSQSQNEENKIVSLQLLAKMAPDMPEDQKQEIIKEQFFKLFKDSSVRVKKEVIHELGLFVENLRPSFVDNCVILDFYLHQCKDTAWGIRKACVQILTSCLKKTQTQKDSLCSVLFDFMKDGNKFVKILAFKTIPEFIANYGSEDVPQKLLDTYVNLIDHEVNRQVSRQYQIILKISFYFPGVLYTVGQKKWPSLRKLFERLLHFRNEDVKMPIASSLHEIARIIGPDQSKQYLFIALDTILKQHSDNLKLTAIGNLGKFVELFQKTTRQNLIDVFLVLQKDPKKWRVRHSISSQLDYLSKIYDPQTIFKYIFPISLKLCNDSVSDVRHEAAKKIIYVINNLKPEEILYQMAIQSIKGYAMSEKYIQRQTFAIMLETMFLHIESIEKVFLEEINVLSKDPVITIRISLAISLQKVFSKHPNLRQNWKQIIKNLSQNEEVAQYLGGLEIE